MTETSTHGLLEALREGCFKVQSRLQRLQQRRDVRLSFPQHVGEIRPRVLGERRHEKPRHVPAWREERRVLFVVMLDHSTEPGVSTGHVVELSGLIRGAEDATVLCKLELQVPLDNVISVESA